MDKVQKPVEELDEPCPTCGRPLVIRTGRFGRFISCSGFPECEYRRSMVVKTGALCPVDGGELLERKTRKSGKVFYGCANYPKCSFATWDRPLALPCPECGGLLTQGAKAPTAACAKCGALVAGVAEGTPEVVGHRDPAAARPSRGARATTGTAKTAAARRTSATRATVARAATTRKAPARKTTAVKAPAVRTPAAKTTTSKATRAPGTATRKATGATRARSSKS
jgi:DNA topoisomerase-1